MTSLGSDNSSNDAMSDDQLFRVDIENACGKGQVTQPRPLVHVWKIPLPLRQQKIRSDLIKNVACVMTLLWVLWKKTIRLYDLLTQLFPKMHCSISIHYTSQRGINPRRKRPL